MDSALWVEKGEKGRHYYEEDWTLVSEKVVETRDTENTPPPVACDHRTTDEKKVKDNDDDNNDKDHARAVGAGVATGLCGFLIGGPLLATCLGLTTAYAAEKDEGPPGEVARSVGDVALKTRDEAQKVNEKWHCTEQINSFLLNVWDSIMDACGRLKSLGEGQDFAKVKKE